VLLRLSSIGSVTSDVELARREWEDAYRRVASEPDPQRAERLHAQVEVVRDELRRRVGGAYTLQELASVYGEAERWVRHAVSEQAPGPGWPRTLSLVEGAAFHVYARGALDYAP
jgi:hypothetical protein